MAAITSAGSGNWSAGATWVGGSVPANGDTVTIASGHTVTFDVDQSGFATGLAGLVITGAFVASTTPGNYVLKMAGNITGTGTMSAGSSGTAYPVTCTFSELITGSYSNQLSASGAYQLWCAQPTTKTVKLTAPASAGATVLSVDTDVSGETAHWKAGQLVRVDNVNSARDSEERTIASVGAGTITLSAGLTGAKIAGTLVHLISRNVKIIGPGSTGTGINGGSNGVINAEIRAFNNGFNYGSGHTVSGTVSGCTNGVYYSSGYTVSGTVSGCINGVNAGTGHAVSGVVSGCTSGVSYSSGHTVSGTVSGCINGAYNGSGILLPSAVLQNNTRDFNCGDGGLWVGKGAILLSTVQVSAYPVQQGGWQGVYIEDINGTAGAYKGWQYGGTVTTVASPAPTGYSQSYQHALLAASPCFWEQEVFIKAGATLRWTTWLRKDASMAVLPRVQLFKAGTEPLVDAAYLLYEQAMTNSVDTWEQLDCSYTNAGATDEVYVIRIQAQNASGNVYSQLTVAAGGGGGVSKSRIIGGV